MSTSQYKYAKYTFIKKIGGTNSPRRKSITNVHDLHVDIYLTDFMNLDKTVHTRSHRFSAGITRCRCKVPTRHGDLGKEVRIVAFLYWVSHSCPGDHSTVYVFSTVVRNWDYSRGICLTEGCGIGCKITKQLQWPVHATNNTAES